MKIELHGTGFEAFEIPKWANGVDVDDSADTRASGKYPVKSIDMLTVLSSGYLYIGVTLRDDDEHLPKPMAVAAD